LRDLCTGSSFVLYFGASVKRKEATGHPGGKKLARALTGGSQQKHGPMQSVLANNYT